MLLQLLLLLLSRQKVEEELGSNEEGAAHTHKYTHTQKMHSQHNTPASGTPIETKEEEDGAAGVLAPSLFSLFQANQHNTTKSGRSFSPPGVGSRAKRASGAIDRRERERRWRPFSKRRPF